MAEERKIQLALHAINEKQLPSLRAAAAVYNVKLATLWRRSKGVSSRSDTPANNLKLTPIEELVIVDRILDLAERGFPMELRDLEEMANQVLDDRDAPQVGKRWAHNFVKRRPELKTRISRRYDYQRALCEDPEIITKWFELVKSTIAKYGVVEADIYNFDETGFMMGMVRPRMVISHAEYSERPKSVQPGNREWATVIESVSAVGQALPPYIILPGNTHLSTWYNDDILPKDWRIAVSDSGWTNNDLTFRWLQHFDQHTKNRTVGMWRLLIIDGHRSHFSAEFQRLCGQSKILTLCMPPHSSHLLQPLDVACFAPLKSAYAREIDVLVRRGINHITKLEFIPSIVNAHKSAVTPNNIRGGFRGAGLIPLDPEAVLSKLDIRLKTPPPDPAPQQESMSKTPYTTTEFEAQFELLERRLTDPENASPAGNFRIRCRIKKGLEVRFTKCAIIEAENEKLTGIIAQKQKRKSRKKQLQKGGDLTVEEARVIMEDGEIEAQIISEDRQARRGTRACRKCRKSGHNLRTCRA